MISLIVCEYFLVLVAPPGSYFGHGDDLYDRGVFDGHDFGIELDVSYYFAPFESYLSAELRSADRCRSGNQVVIEHWMATLVPVALTALLAVL